MASQPTDYRDRPGPFAFTLHVPHDAVGTEANVDHETSTNEGGDAQQQRAGDDEHPANGMGAYNSGDEAPSVHTRSERATAQRGTRPSPPRDGGDTPDPCS